MPATVCRGSLEGPVAATWPITDGCIGCCIAGMVLTATGIEANNPRNIQAGAVYLDAPGSSSSADYFERTWHNDIHARPSILFPGPQPDDCWSEKEIACRLERPIDGGVGS